MQIDEENEVLLQIFMLFQSCPVPVKLLGKKDLKFSAVWRKVSGHLMCFIHLVILHTCSVCLKENHLQKIDNKVDVFIFKSNLNGASPIF